MDIFNTQHSMRVHLAEHMLLIDAQTGNSGPTRRPACVLIWASTDRVFTFSNAHGNLLFEGHAALVAPDVERRLKTIDSNIFSLNIEPGHPHFLALSQLNFEHGFLPLDIHQFMPFSDAFRRHLENADYAGVEAMAFELTNSLLPQPTKLRQRDTRIDTLLPLLDSSSPVELASLAKRLHLSKDRLSHLFSAEIGMPLRSYILWRRYRRAMLALQSGEKISTIAHQVGFYDHAQMSRTFLTLFGYAPSTLKRPEFIHISGSNKKS